MALAVAVVRRGCVRVSTRVPNARVLYVCQPYVRTDSREQTININVRTNSFRPTKRLGVTATQFIVS